MTNSLVAIKKIPKKLTKSLKSRTRVLNEIKSLKILSNHKNVIKLYEVFEDDSFIYLVTEYIENGDLLNYLMTNPLFPESTTRIIMLQIIFALGYIHQNKIIHRDIKLNNILVDSNFNVKVCDFGICSFMKSGKRIRDTGGTPAYLAPEIITENGEISEKSDVWSLGVMLYLLTFGVLPFYSKNISVLYRKIIRGKYEIQEKDEASKDLIELIGKMLTVNTEDRISIEGILRHQ